MTELQNDCFIGGIAGIHLPQNVSHQVHFSVPGYPAGHSQHHFREKRAPGNQVVGFKKDPAVVIVFDNNLPYPLEIIKLKG